MSAPYWTPVQEQYTDYVFSELMHEWWLHSRGLPFYCPGQAGVQVCKCRQQTGQ